MIGKRLARGLTEDWRAPLDEIARKHGGVTSRDVAKLAACVKKLSAAYNDPQISKAVANDKEIAVARLLFSFPRDVPKGAGAVRELIATGALTVTPDKPLRVLDLGCGLGATTWGLMMALDASGARGTVDALLVDPDEAALKLGTSIANAKTSAGGITLKAQFLKHSIERLPGVAGRFDVILIGQVLSELDKNEPEAARVALHAARIVHFLKDHLAPSGALVVIEPALRDRSRHLHAVRDALLALPKGDGAPVFNLFAPCLHTAGCPALVRETDWCHEDLPVDLPSWLVPIAKGAGLRYEGLTFSYLVLRKDGRSLASMITGETGEGERARVISAEMITKGKREAFLCAPPRDVGDAEGQPTKEGTLIRGEQLRAGRLNRDESEQNAAWGEIARGDCLLVTPALSRELPRITAESRIINWGADGD